LIQIICISRFQFYMFYTAADRHVLGAVSEKTMINQRLMIAAAMAAGLAIPAVAAQDVARDVKPIQYQSVDLGAVAGDVYYTVRPDGFHVVATFAQRGDSATPVRFQAVLAPGQTIVFSTPRGVGQPSDAVEVSRRNDRVFVHKAALVD
jgi:hypothetical protein